MFMLKLCKLWSGRWICSLFSPGEQQQQQQHQQQQQSLGTNLTRWETQQDHHQVSSVYLDEFIIFFQIDRGKIASAASNWLKSAPQTDTTTLAFASLHPSSMAHHLYCTRREGKCFHFWLGDVLECRANHLGWFEQKFLEIIHFGRVVVWCGVNRMIIHFSKHPFQKVQLAVILFIFFFNSSWYKIASAVKQQQRPLPSLLYLSLIYATRPA